MKNITLFAISAAALTTAAVAEVEASVSAGIHSRYNFRGIDFAAPGEALVDLGLEAGGSCDCGFDWYAGMWYGSTTNGAAYDETDVYFGISKDFGFGAVDAGFVTYTYDDGTENDSEVYVGLSTSVAGIDFGSTTSIGTGGWWKNGVWQSFTAGYGYDLAEGLSVGIEAGLNLAFGQSVYAPDVDGVASYYATLSLEYAVSEDISFSPYVTFHENTEDFDAASALNNTTIEGWVAGASLSFSF